MFTGIIEALGRVTAVEREGTNRNLCIASPLSQELKVDQSLAHNGVCLTVTAVEGQHHWVTCVAETLNRSNLGSLKEGDPVNLERALPLNGRLDGHLVQGHVDCVGVCLSREEQDGSHLFRFEYPFQPEYLLIDKGSIAVNGVSLTVIEPQLIGKDASDPTHCRFAVAIIPYTFQHTTFQSLQPGDSVNLEFDVIGKYVARYLALYKR